ncbi:MAG: dephospho-CoA kinase [bacterium]
MLVLGITGNIASGKTSVARMLKKRTGGVIVNADEVLKELTTPESTVWGKIVQLFGKEIVAPKSKELNRAKIAEIVFKDIEKLKKLEAITHPSITRSIKQKINAISKKAPNTVIIVEAIKLLDSTIEPLVDAVLLVTTERELQFNRLMQDRDFSMPQAVARVGAYTAPTKHAKISWKLENKGTIEELEKKVIELAKEIDIMPKTDRIKK